MIYAIARRLKPAATVILIALAVFLAFTAISPTDALAQSAPATISAGLEQAADGTYSGTSLASFIGNIIKALLGATGIIFLVLTVYAGILYMTAMGAPDKVKKAKDMLTQALIGLMIIIGAYALTRFVVDELSQASVAAPTCPADNPDC